MLRKGEGESTHCVASGCIMNGVQGEIDGVHPQPLVVQDDPLPEVDIGILQVDEEAA